MHTRIDAQALYMQIQSTQGAHKISTHDTYIYICQYVGISDKFVERIRVASRQATRHWWPSGRRECLGRDSGCDTVL